MPFRFAFCKPAMVLGLLVIACSPALDWREVRPEGGGLVVLFPCKPERQTRQLSLAGAPVALQLVACSAAGSTWGLSTADMADSALVGPALAALRASRLRNLEGKETSAQPLRQAGRQTQAQPQAVRISITGQRPDGSPITEHAVLFAQGTRVFHAAVLGGEPPAEALENFFGGLKLQP